MANPAERRKSARIPVNIPAGIYLKDKPYEVIDAEILSISERGAFVHCSTKIQLGKEVLIEIRFAETKLLQAKVVENDGERDAANEPTSSVVKWSREDSEAGFGVEFVDLKPDKQKFLSKLVAYFSQLNRAGVDSKG